MSNIPAFERSLKSVVSKIFFRFAVCGSPESGLKSATAMRMLETPLDVSVLNQSCACREAAETNRRSKATRREDCACRMGEVRFGLCIHFHLRRKKRMHE